MPWQHVICHTSSKVHQESINDLMETHHVLSITIQDAEDNPVLEPLPGETPLWDTLIITALFEEDANLKPLVSQLNTNKKLWDMTKISTEVLEDQVWERAWMKNFHPMQFGDNLWIYPSGYEIPDDNSVKILLDPGLAFGTGTHPTTALCLEWLDQNPPDSLNVIDYGCGSGVLAIAAIKLGAKHIVATDIDPQALTATLDNMQRNSIAREKISRFLPENCPDTPVDLLMANILSGPLVELYPKLNSLIISGGTLVLSGILEDQQDDVVNTYSVAFENIQVKMLDGWIRINATKK